MRRVAVLGAGAVGCYYGARLAQAGVPVTMIGRPAHVEAMKAHGLRLQTASGEVTVPVQSSTDAAAAAGADLVLCCVKSGDTDAAAAQLAGVLKPGALVLSLQNGVDNAARLRAGLPDAIAVDAAVVYVATEMAGPGHVRHLGRGELVVGPVAAAHGADALLTGAGITVDVSDNVIGALWAKLILNCAYNALSAGTRLPYGRLVQVAGVPEVMHDVMRECLAVAQAAGVTVPGDPAAAIRRIAETMPAQFSSTAQDVMRGKPSEIDHLNGLVVREGTRLGVATPVNRTLWALVRGIEAAQPDRSDPGS